MTSLRSGPLGELTTKLDFARLLDQHDRMLLLDTALPRLALVAERLVLREAVSQPYELVVDALSPSRHFELKALVGEQMSVRRLQPDGSYAPWHGYVAEAAQLGADGGLARYRLVMRPWLWLLGLRRDSFVYQDKTALEIVEEVFADYPQAQYALQVSEPLRRRSLCVQYRESDLAFVQRLLAEEGLSYHFRHLEGEQARQADEAGQARHRLVITDRQAERDDLGELRFAVQHASANLRGQRDAVTAFMAQRSVVASAVTLASWDYKALSGTAGQAASALALGEIPALEVYDGTGAYRYADAEHAERAAALALAALELQAKRFEGQGSARHLRAGAEFTLVDHPLYGPNTSAPDYAGARTASRQRPDNAFVVLAVEHHASNNLGGQLGGGIARLDEGPTTLEAGTYKCHFHCAPAAAALVPARVRKPTAPGLQTALVVGVANEPVTTERDLRVKVQFAWQRGQAPLAGGLAHASTTDAQGNAPGDERSGTWVRVAVPSAGANWGSAFVPRVGTEVAVQFIEGDIDRPAIVGQLYNGADPPPFAAGADAGVNHPGVISGLHSHALDGAGYNQWVLDDATGQLRMRLASSHAGAQLNLGHLIQQPANSAQRGAWRGAGFEANTQGWASVRAGHGLLVSTTARAGSYGSAQSTQMDAAEAVAQLKAARELGQRLGEVAAQGGAQPLTSHDANQATEKFIHAIDPKAEGKHAGAVNGQPAQQAGADGRTLQEGEAGAVAAFAWPQVLLETPSTAALASEAGITAFAGQDTSLVAQGDLHQAAGHTYAQVSGRTSSLYTHQGGVKAYAANGPVSLRAHTDALQIWADQDVTVISVNDEIRISARSTIEVIGGQSAMVLEGGNITFSCPGTFAVKSATHAFLDGGSRAAELPVLPTGLQQSTNWIAINHRDPEGEPMAGQRYKIFFEGGAVISGALDAAGHARHENVPDKAMRVEYEPRKPEKDKPWDPLAKLLSEVQAHLS
ncbi:type VI secretion system Vgr family protein [Pseudorhodoferax sp.]|uniref:type VI secretion system Vgr family protein n=1 Tax=Pseudorhodoferax sp. TaxID=1993553 RepID=UPI0039E570EF